VWVAVRGMLQRYSVCAVCEAVGRQVHRQVHHVPEAVCNEGRQRGMVVSIYGLRKIFDLSLSKGRCFSML
jgi:hypothetical protein